MGEEGSDLAIVPVSARTANILPRPAVTARDRTGPSTRFRAWRSETRTTDHHCHPNLRTGRPMEDGTTVDATNETFVPEEK